MTKLKFLTCLLFVNYSFSQKIENENYDTKTALLVINSLFLDRAVMDKIPTNAIESLEVLKENDAIKRFGKQGKNGAIVIRTKKISSKELKKLYALYPSTIELNVKSQIKKITGKVTDCENIPLPNILVQNINTKKSVFTDSLGEFSLEMSKNDILSFSNERYQPLRLQYTNQKKIVTALKIKDTYGNIMVEKPVIYLYPKEKTDVELSLKFDGKILTTFPKLEKSWNVTAYENGQIFDKKTNRFYTSLFWDGEISFPPSHYQYKTGFIVEKEKLASFLIEKLEFMGLNTVETNEFIQYWLPILERNKTTFIHFLVNENYDVFSTNYVTPKPDTSIRILMEFFGVDAPISIPPQELPKTIRKGFTLVEWGGSDVSNQLPLNYLKLN